MNWHYAGTHVIADTPNYLFEIEVQECGLQMLFVHLIVRKWSKAILKEMLGVFAKFRESFPVPLYCVGLGVDDPKFERFVARFGFVPIINYVVRENGEPSRLYICERQ